MDVKFSDDLKEKLSPMHQELIKQITLGFANLADPHASLFRLLNISWFMTVPSNIETYKTNGAIVQCLSKYNQVRGLDNSKASNS